MSGAELKKVEEKREAMVNCSKAVVEAIRSYGHAATLDLLVRVSNRDTVVSELLPYFPSIASNAMLGDSDSKLLSKLVSEIIEEKIPKSNASKSVTPPQPSPSKGKGRGRKRHQLSLFSYDTKK